MNIQHFFDPNTYTLTYVVSDEVSLDAVIIDPVLDFDPASGKISDDSLKAVLEYIQTKKYNVRAILETHAHADHLSSSQLLKNLFPKAILGIGEKIQGVQEVFKNYFHLSYLKTDGSQFDIMLKDFEEVSFGTLKMKALPTPGHTPACMSFLFEDAVFTGDALFMPDYGTGRCDFPKGSSRDLYYSISNHLYTLPENTRVFVGHDYSPNGRKMMFETTIKESKLKNVQLKLDTTEESFVNFRDNRDKTLQAPRLLWPSIQVNVDGGHLPPAEENEKMYLKIPLSLNLKLGKL
jgi:glyoxylase-like metal-dependent hydrolase (beta-lactamase superfamily II)